MHTIAGYAILEQVDTGTHALVFRARRQSDQLPVMLKVLGDRYPSPERIAWFKREYQIIRSLDVPGVVAAYALEHIQQRWMLVLEDFGGESLVRLKLAGKLALNEFLHLAMTLTDILGQMHQRYVIHKDINPANIVYNPATGQVKLIDFGIASVLSREMATFRNPRSLEGTLAYMSPEQTGRMNRAIDYRTDFYSLGVTFYELLTGQMPFQSEDTLELIHSHIARQPISPDYLRADIPPELSAVIMKLMARNADDRYQSAYGLKADLELIQALVHDSPAFAGDAQRRDAKRNVGAKDFSPLPVGYLHDSTPGDPTQALRFVPGTFDQSDRFQLPQKLYGRAWEIEMLLAAFERVSRGASELMLVSGAAGIGKTALVQEIYIPITRQRGTFIAGKFDQLQRNRPYAALIQAFRSLARYLLASSTDELATWRERLLAAVGANGRVIIDVIPEIEHVIGPQLPVPDLDPAAAQNRFHLVFQQFIQVFTRLDHPLVLFLDDMQWADSASLKLVENLLSAASSQHLFLVAAYRDNEVAVMHPLRLMARAVARSGVEVQDLLLEPLDVPTITDMLNDALNCPAGQSDALAELVVRKTNGNPFFLGVFLQSLYRDALLWFDQAHWVWQCDLEQISQRQMTDNVVEFMTKAVQRLNIRTYDSLKLAACIGNQFDLTTLAIVSEQLAAEVARSLEAALHEGLIVPVSDAYKLATQEVAGLNETIDVRYAFAHDRIQQAAYNLIPQADRQIVHWRIGRLLLHNTPLEQREERIFDLVYHLNHGQALITSLAERDDLVALNVLASQCARAAAAYDTASGYAQVGLQIADDDLWQRQYDLALQLYVTAAEVAYLSGDYAWMQSLATVVLRRARTLLDTVRIYETQMKAARARNQLLESLHIALEVLELLGIRFPPDPQPDDIGHALAETSALLADTPIETLIDLPAMRDPDSLAAVRILNRAITSAYNAAPALMPLIVLKQVSLSFRYGNAPESAFSYVLYGLILCGVVGDIDRGYRFGHLARTLLERMHAREPQPRTFFCLNAHIRHWKEHIQATLEPLQDAYLIGLETGDLEFAALAIHIYCYSSYFIGRPLASVEQEMTAYAGHIAQLKQGAAYTYLRIYHQAVLNLLGHADDLCCLCGDVYDETTMVATHQEANDATALYVVALNKLMLGYLSGDYTLAYAQAAQAEGLLDAVTSLILVPLYHFYAALARLAVYADATPAEQAHILDSVDASQQKMQHWATHAPMNYRHKFLLVAAERARVTGLAWEAGDLYDQAIDLAQQHGYVNEEALACELAARFYLQHERTRLAHIYLRDARYAYLRWGARAKVDLLDQQFPWLQTLDSAAPGSIRRTPIRAETASLSTALDVLSVVKAAQALSSELALKQLLTRLMQIVIENAGAQRGVLLLPQTDTWVIKAAISVEQTDVALDPAIPLPETVLPMAVINYVCHTQESLVLDDAASQSQFATDPYIAADQPRSLVCLPLIHQGNITGILYLENRQVAGAFTSDHLTVLQIIASQAAISIENARLYADVQSSEDKYRTLFEGSRDTIFITTPSGAIIDISPSCEELFGYSRAELRGMRAQDMYTDVDRRMQFRHLLEQHGMVRDFEATFRHKDGSERHCLMTAIARPDAHGTVQEYHGIIRDITAHKQAEQELDRHRLYLEEMVAARTSELSEKTTWLEATLQNMDQGIIMVDAQQHLVTYNQRFVALFGLTEAFFTPLPDYVAFLRFWAEQGSPGPRLLESAMQSAPCSTICSIEIAEPDGRFIEVHHSPFVEGGFVQTFTDITRRKQAEAALNRYVQQLEALRLTMTEISIELELPRLLEAVLERATRLLDGTCGELALYDEANNDLHILARYNFNIERASDRQSPGEGAMGHVALTHQPLIINDYQAWAGSMPEYSHLTIGLLVMPMMVGEHLIGVIGVAHDGSRRSFDQGDVNLLSLFAQQATIAIQNARLFTEVQHLAITDSLTDLYNRYHFFSMATQTAAQAVRYARPLSIMLLDIDNFKQINDTYGHLIGDQVLRTIADQCRTSLRAADTIARYGGEEIIVLMAETPAEGAWQMARRLCQDLAQADIVTEYGVLHITASIGLATYPGTGKLDLDRLIDQADQALYRAKRGGKNQVVLWDDVLSALPAK